MKKLTFSILETDGRQTSIIVPIQEILLAGYTGRDRAKVLEHIRELAVLGVAPPEQVPMVYIVPAELATMDPLIAVGGPETSGEAEFYLVPTANGLLVGIGSDHTDRKQEAVDVAASKALCPKALSPEVWRYDSVRGHWDQLEIRSWVTDQNGRRLYQQGRLDTLLAVEDILAEIARLGHQLEGRIVFGGTLPTIGDLTYGGRFTAELRDPVLGRSIRCAYDVGARNP